MRGKPHQSGQAEYKSEVSGEPVFRRESSTDLDPCPQNGCGLLPEERAGSGRRVGAESSCQHRWNPGVGNPGSAALGAPHPDPAERSCLVLLGLSGTDQTKRFGRPFQQK